MLADAPGKISLTSDGWTSDGGDKYSVVTASWIDADWKKQSIVSDFIDVPEANTGAHLRDVALSILTGFGISRKSWG